ncbi:MAG: hypothetical protein ACFE8V_15110 [Promethearchaeota archaeon]
MIRSPKFFEVIFNDLRIYPDRAIVIEDHPKFIESALKSGAQVIQACVTGDFTSQYPFYVENMNDLPNIIDNLIETLNL